MRVDHSRVAVPTDTRRKLSLLHIFLVIAIAGIVSPSTSHAGGDKPKGRDDQNLLDAVDHLRLRDLPAARIALAPLCPGDLQDAVRGAKKKKMPCRLIITAETEERGTRSADRISLIYWTLADDARKENDFTLAKALYAVAIDRYPADPENWYWLGIVERDLGRFPESRQALARAIELKPDHRDARYWTATDLMDEGSYGESVELLNQLLASDPNDGRVWYRRGEVLGHQGRCDEARADLEKARALRVDPKKINERLKACTSDGSGN
jgi:tetratricopeptide (TPR) repeat protein